MHGELSQATVYPNGVCPRHNAALITMDGRPTCLGCQRDAAKAERRMAEVNTEVDPGHDALKELLKQKIKELPDKELVTAEAKQRTQPLAAVASFADHMKIAVDHLRKAPMPTDLKAFKAVQKAIGLLEKLTEDGI